MRVFLIGAALLAGFFSFNDAATRGLEARIECMDRLQKYESRMFEEKIKEKIEEIREKLRQGIPEQNIPPLDPFVLNNFNVKIDQELIKLDWNMTDGQITGLLGFNVTHVAFNLAGLKFQFNVSFPEIAGNGKYGLKGLLGDIIPLVGNGDFDVSAKVLDIGIDGKLGTRDEHLFLEKFDITISLDEFYIKVTGLMNDPKLSELIGQMLSDALPGLIDEFQPEIDQFVSGKITEFANKWLSNKTISDIIGGLGRDGVRDYIACGSMTRLYN